MEDYKKKYEHALDNFKKIKAANKDNKELVDFIEYEYPDLEDREDERIRRDIIRYLKKTSPAIGENIEKMIAWLEKQDEQIDIANKEYWRGYREGKQEIIDKYSDIEKQCKQKEINLVEILKHCPRETELYSPLYGKLWLAEVDEEHEIITCYKRHLDEGCVRAILEQEDTVSFYSNGTTGLPDFSISKDCMLFLYDSEKQGEQKPVISDDALREGIAHFGITQYQINNWLKKYVDVEKQGEQKPIDKVEPKFKIGDWVIDKQDIVHQITNVIENVTNHTYGYDTADGEYFNDYVEGVRLWTIQDAKEGDVIFSNDGHGSDSIELIKSIYDECINFWFCLSSKNNFKDYYYEVYNGNIPYTNFASRKDATPATQEQRDLLFAKMKEAGYEWDDEKKELKKIEQKPAWSKEDEIKRNALICLVEEIKTQPLKRLEDWDGYISWLKSIKERHTWKPSDEQMDALNEVINYTAGHQSIHLNDYLYNILKQLKSQLKKLKGE